MVRGFQAASVCRVGLARFRGRTRAPMACSFYFFDTRFNSPSVNSSLRHWSAPGSSFRAWCEVSIPVSFPSIDS
uniref:Uncharacterized protein n=2 Tax=Picea TaxID=3328 RepID=A0A101M516_PICGL|nr:hypothetical protein ABT39_MTgene1057 [Picea glauca]QHR90020.1 hypothetical protein Q903MT_gene4043 [Picea sitchensis]